MRYRLDEMFDEEFEHVMAEIRGAGTRQEARRIIREHRQHLEYHTCCPGSTAARPTA
jgi:hypothetical protein